jgi:hypothetical protein
MPSRRLSRGYVPQRKQALDPEAGLLSLAPSGGPLGSMTGAELPRRLSKPEWDWARFDNCVARTIVSLHAGKCTLLAASRLACRSIGPTLSSDFVDRAIPRARDAIANIFIFLDIELRLDRLAISKDYSSAGGPWPPAAARPSWQPGGVLMNQQAVQTGGKQR